MLSQGVVNWNEKQGWIPESATRVEGNWEKGRVESGSGVKEDFWEEVGFDSKLKGCITETLEK